MATHQSVLFLAMGTQTPGSRFRVQQFFPHFESFGIRCTLKTAYGDEYQSKSRSRLRNIYKLRCRLKRALAILDTKAFDAVFLQRTALQYSALPEWFASKRNSRLILDFDDAIFLGSGGKACHWSHRAFETAVRVSRHVIAGNRYLAEHTSAPEKTTVIPTVIDTDVYTPQPKLGDNGRIVVGWMGTAVNLKELSSIQEAIECLLASYPHVTFRIVSNETLSSLTSHPQVEHISWSAERELELLRSFDIGLMPLEDSPWSRGKCGFKMIQYMTVGCPVVASAVGANCELLGQSRAGTLVHSDDQWYEALCRLVEDRDFRLRTGNFARERAVSNYSIKAVVGKYLEIFDQVCNSE